MKNAVRLALALCALALATPAAAQQAPPQARPQIGFGISIVPLEVAGQVPTVEVYLPIRIAPQFRLEPSLGIFSRDQAGTLPDTRDVTLGIGGFWLAPVAAQVDLYAGGRLKLNFAHESTPAGSTSDTDVSIAAALGGEYYLVPHFSLGLEGQLGYFSHGSVNGDDSGFFTTGVAFLRLYFK
jgi:hypothetical protein